MRYKGEFESKLTAVSGTGLSASFVYDGDGNRVKGTVNGVTTVHIGAYFEWTGSTSTMKKYYNAGGARIAMRTGSSTLNFILTDHLGSTSVTTDSNGALLTDNRYKAWGESRYASSTLPTKFTYTGSPLGQEVPRGQYSYVADFGLMYYGARWYDSYCLHLCSLAESSTAASLRMPKKSPPRTLAFSSQWVYN
jgi:hypothetical protein